MDSNIQINKTNDDLSKQQETTQHFTDQGNSFDINQYNQITNSLNLQIYTQLLEQAKTKIDYFQDCEQTKIQEWIQIYQKSENSYSTQNKVKQNIEKQVNIQQTDLKIVYQFKDEFDLQLQELKRLVNEIKEINKDKILLIGQFSIWMSGYGMMEIPLQKGGKYRIIGKIEFGQLIEGIFITSYGYKYKGKFIKNKLNGYGVITTPQIIFKGNFENNRILNGDFEFIQNDQRKFLGKIEFNQNQYCFNDLTYIDYQRNFRVELSNLDTQQIINNLKVFLENQETLIFQQNRLIEGFGKSVNENYVYFGEFKNNNLFGYGQIKTQNELYILQEGIFENNLLTFGKIYYDYNNNENQQQLLKEEGTFQNGLLNGQGIKYYENQNKQEEGQFANGQLNGEGVKYFVNNNKQEEGKFENGLLVEGKKYYKSNQNIQEVGKFENGLLVEGTKYYESNQNIFERGKFENGQLQGEGERRHENGYCHQYGIFLNGLLDSDEFQSGVQSDQGIFLEQGYFKNGKLNGKAQRNYESGKLHEIGYFQNGQLNDQTTLATRYYDNEKNIIAEYGYFQNGQFHSPLYQVKSFYKDGKLKYLGNFQDGQYANQGKLYFNHYILEGRFSKGQINGSVVLRNCEKKVQLEVQQLSKEIMEANNRNIKLLERAYELKVFDSKNFTLEAETQTSEILMAEKIQFQIIKITL